MKVRKAIIPAAGLGTRFLPATKATPKEMLPIVDKPTIQYIIEEAIQSGIEDIIIVTGKNKRAIEDHFDFSSELEQELESKGKEQLLEMVQDISNMVNINYIRQKKPLGLGHAIHCAKSFIHNEPFAVLLGDDIVDSEIPCLKQLMNVYEETNKSVLGVKNIPTEELHKYGVIATDNYHDSYKEVTNIIEKPKTSPPSNLGVIGRYILQPEVMDILPLLNPTINNEIQLTDALQVLASKNSLIAFEFEGKRYDVGDKLGFLQATVEFALKRKDLKDDFQDYLIGLLKEKGNQ